MSEHRHPVVSGREISLDDPNLLDILRNFHGHIGPYVVLGFRIGERARQILGAEKYFGMRVAVAGPRRTPYTCLLDGLQLSTGCTMGKGNIALLSSDPPQGTLFELQFTSEDQELVVTVSEEVEATFAGWMQASLTEDQIFARVRDMPADDAWTERLEGGSG